MESAFQSRQLLDAQRKGVFSHFPKIALGVLFGSVASGRQRADSDLYIAVAAERDELVKKHGFTAYDYHE
jgi:predicted nucleotidyltransferase